MNRDIEAVVVRVAARLCDLPTEHQLSPSQSCRGLVFPSYRPKNGDSVRCARISEAEARILFCLELDGIGLPYAVEVPTLQQYAFSGSTDMSARTDLIVYASQVGPPTTLVRDLAIEFKAHNPRTETIRKDLEKLLREDCDGLWFHLLKNADSGTIPALGLKFSQSIRDLREVWRECSHTQSLYIVVREKRLLLHRTLVPGQDSFPDLSIDYAVRGGKVEVNDAGDWRLQAL